MKPPLTTRPTTIDEYLVPLPADKRAALQWLRRQIKAAAPDAEECISYGVPAFRLDGRMVVAFGAAAKHCAFYPGAIVEEYKRELQGYDTSKGTIRFQPHTPLPAALVRRLVKGQIARRRRPVVPRRKRTTLGSLTVSRVDFRRIALGMTGAVEGAHMGHPDFRAGGRIFATLRAEGQRGMVALTPEQQHEFVQEHPGAFEPESGAWGRQGCTAVRLDAVDDETLGEALTLAWQNAARPAIRRRSQEPAAKRPRRRRRG